MTDAYGLLEYYFFWMGAEVFTEKLGSGGRHKTHMAYHWIQPMLLQSEDNNELCELLRSYLLYLNITISNIKKADMQC
jgi:hypothetical protein